MVGDDVFPLKSLFALLRFFSGANRHLAEKLCLALWSPVFNFFCLLRVNLLLKSIVSSTTDGSKDLHLSDEEIE